MNRNILLGVLALAFVSTACVKKSQEKPQPTPVPQATAVEAKPVKSVKKTGRYVVKKGDSLWKISAKKTSGLGDPFRWPLLFKANRDQISDPDLIDERQDLNIKKQYTKEEIADAIDKAKATPPYTPHDAPRKTLPVQY